MSDPSTPAASASASDRLHSLDALRGFDMFWLLGGQQIVHALCAGAAAGSVAYAVNQQFTHVQWEGSDRPVHRPVRNLTAQNIQ